jgi:hypothetical protein
VDRVRKIRQEDVLDRPWGEENLSGKENEVPEKAGAMVHEDFVVSGLEASETPPANLLEDLSRMMLVKASDEENEPGVPAIPVETLDLENVQSEVRPVLAAYWSQSARLRRAADKGLHHHHELSPGQSSRFLEDEGHPCLRDQCRSLHGESHHPW